MSAIGIDLGGTKIEAQVFDSDWNVVAKSRVPTPQNYPELIASLSEQISWCSQQTESLLPIGIGAAGLVNTTTGHTLTANLCASHKPLPRDIEDLVGKPITYLNDCRAFTLSESVFGAGKEAHTVIGLIIGTGIGGGITIGGRLLAGPTHTGGEFGHTSASASLIIKHGLPVFECGCGHFGCIEPYISGPGLNRIATELLSRDVDPRDIAALRKKDSGIQNVWNVWRELLTDLLRNLILTVDPDVIVLGGGLSLIDGLVEELQLSLSNTQINGFSIPSILLADGGDVSGARGAAYAAWQEHSSV